MQYDVLLSSPLGQTSEYVSNYDKSLLFPILRQLNRGDLGIDSSSLPFKGYDLWTAYELSWLDPQGKPRIAVADIIIPCETPNIIESKSLKLYFNSFNNTQFDSAETVRKIMVADLSEAAGGLIEVNFSSFFSKGHFEGECLDELNVSCSTYQVTPSLLAVGSKLVSNQSLHTHLLRSNCPVTAQPDWGSVLISYSGQEINKASLLQYIVSFRHHREFHEQCVERIFVDIMTHCAPTELTVYARLTRRGGLDINPIRSTKLIKVPVNQPLFRQ